MLPNLSFLTTGENNARLTPKGRALMPARLEVDRHQLDVAQAMGVSLTTSRSD
jgi:hypothetical protein